eukprot:TRINITY_DN14696_c0_g1_i1.p1 TRINITY_DN14696_c0_g1~~TRINITY_DN14696_c0_g1_i1.p1  ORF type:complete len:496 (-),score=122.87 TRINITY_DN14696_c0_g1_i1:54-1541(-)
MEPPAKRARVAEPEAGNPQHQYDNPLVDRYASKEMSFVWSPQKKFSTWRRLWLTLAQCEQRLGLKITDEQLHEMEAHLDDIDFAAAKEIEKKLRHDVMSHIEAWKPLIPNAHPIVHLGATSCYVGDNTDLIVMKESCVLLRRRLLLVMSNLRAFALQTKDIATLGRTHLQPAQLTTVGKRAALWLQDFVMDFHEIEALIEEIPFRGVKGTTGTQASFLELFDGDHEKVKELDRMVTAAMGFKKSIAVAGQTYTRKIDFKVLSVLSGIAQSAAKMANDMRILMAWKEVEEPWEKSQIGSSAMAYKRNPMRSERVCSIARFIISLLDNPAHTHATQWFERTLDDSANRRLSLPQAFLATDGVLSLVANIVDGIQVWPNVIRKNVLEELPFMATENILMACVKAGGNRQLLHEHIRQHSNAAGRRVKEDGAPNDLMERIAADEAFAAVRDQLAHLTNPALFVGRAPEQVVEFVSAEVDPILAKYKDDLSTTTATEIKV